MGQDLKIFKEELVKHLAGGEAFMPVDKMLAEISYGKIGERPGDLPYSFYEIFYHLWFAQKDIMEYCLAENYTAPKWPEEYWPERSSPDTEAEWMELQQAFFKNQREISDYLLDPATDLIKSVRPGSEHTLLREVLLIIEHNAYHTGQLLILLRELGLH